jgi:GNAT superfamily N-acetyltransferase
MEYALLGWPPDGPKLELDYRRFSYAGKFVMTSTGKAVARADDEIVAAVAFNADRTDATTLWLRYVTVHKDHRGEGIAPRLSAFVARRASERGYERARIAVNNLFAYQALYRAGFAFTGEETGIAELVLERSLAADDPARSRDRYQRGLGVFRERDRDLSDEEAAFLREHRSEDPPAVVDAP